MDKLDLLARLPQAYPNNPTALALAKLRLSDEDIGKLVAGLERRQTWASRVSTFSFVLAVVVVFFLLINDKSLSSAQVFEALGSVVASLAVYLWLVTPLNMLPQLAPLQGTPLCEDALALVKSGGPNVAAWRNTALRERNQLYCFDYNIMYLLGAAYRTAQDDATRQEAINLACRELHEIS